MKRVIIIHCWGGNSNHCWYPWAKKELEKQGFQVEIPDFPNTDNPDQAEWLAKLQEVAQEPDEDLFLIGHSLGNVLIMRYLESLNEGQKIGGAVMVAAFTDDLGYEEIKNFSRTPLDFEKIKKHCSRFIAIQSDNDPYIDIKYADILRKEIGAEVIVKHNAGHFTGPVGEEGSCTELPDVIESIIKIGR